MYKMIKKLIDRIIATAPSWAVETFNCYFVRILYRIIDQNHICVQKKVVNGKCAYFEYSSKESWEMIKFRLEKERPVLFKIIEYTTDKNYNVFYDIGANIGTFSSFIGQEIEKTIAFEPYKPNVNLLKKNLRINQVNSDVRSVAVGDQNVETELRIPLTDEPGTEQATILGSHPENYEFIREIKVDSVKIDDYIEAKKIPKPDLVKIDIEGAGMKALDGMKECLISDRPDIFIEPHKNAEEIKSFLRDIGYELKFVSPAREEDEHPTIIAE